jgi:hypothetical protein
MGRAGRLDDAAIGTDRLEADLHALSGVLDDSPWRR